MKIIFVTGGVISGLGKGITAASIGMLLEQSGYSIQMMKLDPYLNIDAGTMSPYEHGEVFVTEDGMESDLDLGHYERYLSTNITKQSSITTGRIYKKVLEKERSGAYLGDDIQVIPHVVNEVKESIISVAENYDITIIEIGGTIGDIEGPHFTEAARQLKRELGPQGVFFVHVVPVLYLQYSGEFKTKPIQHSYKELTRLGIQADMFMCRTEHPLPEHVKEKISLFCDVEKEYIIENLTLESIYQLPILLEKQQAAEKILNKLSLKTKKLPLKKRSKLVDKVLYSDKTVDIGIVGKYTEQQDSYMSVVEALRHAGAHLDHKVNLIWIDAEEFENKKKRMDISKQISGLIIPGGFGQRGMEGKIKASEFCRKQNVPFLGICLGLQMAVIEYCRNELTLANAHTIEADIDCTPVISYMPGQNDDLKKGGTMRLGSYITELTKGSLAEKLYKKRRPNGIKKGKIKERHRHRYEVNPDFYDLLEKKGLHLSGRDSETNLVEFIEIKDHPYFIATQAHPEFTSKLHYPHPLFCGFIEASIAK